MAKVQVLHLDPSNELIFKGPFTEYVTSNLHLTNPTNKPVYFKVKTTAPSFYCVRPNSGVVKPSEIAIINVMLQPVDQSSDLEIERTRHKFMIQTAFGPDDETPVATFWKSVEPSEVMDSKLRVLFIRSNGEVIEAPFKDIGPGGAASADENNSCTFAPSNKNKNVSLTPLAPSLPSVYTGEVRDHLLQKEIELRKMYQDEKSNLERENNALMEKLSKLAQSAGNFNIEGLPLLHVILVAILALLVGIIFGKILF